MAVVWLNSAISSWNVSAFDYWDEATQSIQPYGQVPQAGDIFYLNGFNVTNNSILLDGVIITNGDNEYTGRSGGAFSGVSSYTIRCKELNIYNNIIASTATNNSITLNINAAINLLGSGILYQRGGSGAINVNINGNVFRNNIGSSIISGDNRSGTFTINGNFETYKPIGTHVNFVLNGNVIVHNTGILTQNASNLTINGDIILDRCRLANYNISLLNVNGASLTYDGDVDPLKGLLPSNTLNILNPDYTINRTGDNILYSAIFTKYTMNNRQQYPPEDEVKEGTEYVWGEKIGTYQQPPESVVLKDYVYDNGNKVGTLENEVTVTNTNTINVYPYKKRQ